MLDGVRLRAFKKADLFQLFTRFAFCESFVVVSCRKISLDLCVWIDPGRSLQQLDYLAGARLGLRTASLARRLLRFPTVASFFGSSFKEASRVEILSESFMLLPSSTAMLL